MCSNLYINPLLIKIQIKKVLFNCLNRDKTFGDGHL